MLHVIMENRCFYSLPHCVNAVASFVLSVIQPWLKAKLFVAALKSRSQELDEKPSGTYGDNLKNREF